MIVAVPTSAMRPGHRVVRAPYVTARRVVEDRDPEVAVDEVAEVHPVLVQQAALVAEAELDLERPSSRRRETRVPGHHHLRPALPGMQTRDDEVDRDRRPGGDDVEPQPANDEPHSLSSPLRTLPPAGTRHRRVETVTCSVSEAVKPARLASGGSTTIRSKRRICVRI